MRKLASYLLILAGDVFPSSSRGGDIERGAFFLSENVSFWSNVSPFFLSSGIDLIAAILVSVRSAFLKTSFSPR